MPTHAPSILQDLNAQYGVIESVDALKGWHLVDATLYKPGVYRIAISRYTPRGAEFRHGFASQAIITTARELAYLSTPNGFTLPHRYPLTITTSFPSSTPHRRPFLDRIRLHGTRPKGVRPARRAPAVSLLFNLLTVLFYSRCPQLGSITRVYNL